MKVIAIHGRAGVGKTYLARELVDSYTYAVLFSLADPLKDFANNLRIEDKSFLQEVGTLVRSYNENAFINCLISEMYVTPYVSHLNGIVVIDDVRHQNELDGLCSKYDTFKIKIEGEFSRDDGRDPDHESEEGLDDGQFHLVVPFRSSYNQMDHIKKKIDNWLEMHEFYPFRVIRFDDPDSLFYGRYAVKCSSDDKQGSILVKHCHVDYEDESDALEDAERCYNEWITTL